MPFDASKPYLVTDALNGLKFFWQGGTYYDSSGNAFKQLPAITGFINAPMPSAGWRSDNLAFLVAPDGTEIAVLPPLPQRQGAAQYNAATSGCTMWLPLQEGTGTSGYDMFSASVATGTGNFWGQLPGVNFSGANQLQFPLASPNPIGNLKWIMPLSTLASDGSDSIVVWFVATHPTTIAGVSTMFYWGLNTTTAAPGGWGMRCATSTNPFWLHTAVGASAQDSQNIGIAKFSGDAGTNTQTAFAMEICRNVKNPTLFQIRTAKRTIFTVPPDNPPASNTGQQDVGLLTPKVLGSGTGATGACGAPAAGTLTLGATCTTNASTFTDVASSGVALLNMGFQRRKTTHGVSYLIAKDLNADIYSFPKSAIL